MTTSSPTIPAEIRVGPHRVNVDSSLATARLLRSEEANGDSRPDDLLIRIDLERPPSAVAVTLLHELLHVLWNQMTALPRDHDAGEEERIVKALAPQLLDAMRRNPELVEFLLNAD